MATPLLLAHVMAWYASKPFRGVWGWHWTMDRFQPDRTGPDGRREAASHTRPAIGLYDSGDPHAIECQVQCLKLAGIDGIVVDWYGVTPFRDYGEIHENTQRLIAVVRKAGLRYAICYEDQSVKHLAAEKHLPAERAEAEGRAALEWLDRRCFGDPAYVRVDGRPLLLVFGPQHFDRDAWRRLRDGCRRTPRVVGLPHLPAIDGAFGWPPVSGGKEISPEVWGAYLDALYARLARNETVVAVAFPGFRDIYREAGLHDSYGSIDPRGGKTLEETLDRARRSGAPVIQIASWNDYGEGTGIEPTDGPDGYRLLETVQRFQKAHARPKAPFGPDDLRLPAHLYALRKRPGRADTRLLDAASTALLAGRVGDARNLLARVRP